MVIIVKLFFNRAYFQSVLELQEFFPDGFLKNLHLDIIPNFCIFGGYNYGLIERTVKKQIEMYRKGKHRFDEDPNMSQIIEQMSFFPHFGREMSSDLLDFLIG